LNTSLLAKEIKDQLSFVDKHGTQRQPHLIINLASRAVVEPNTSWEENLEAGWFDDDGNRVEPPSIAWEVYSLFHSCADQAVQSVQEQFGCGLLLDIHGLAAEVPIDMYGYLVWGIKYQKPVEEFAEIVRNESSLRYAAGRKKTAQEVMELISGKESLASLVDEAYQDNFPEFTDSEGNPRGRPATPSARFPYPKGDSSPTKDRAYFSGGYDIEAHSSYKNGINVDAIQIETTPDARNTEELRKRFAGCLKIALNKFLSLHYALEVNSTIST